MEEAIETGSSGSDRAWVYVVRRVLLPAFCCRATTKNATSLSACRPDLLVPPHPDREQGIGEGALARIVHRAKGHQDGPARFAACGRRPRSGVLLVLLTGEPQNPASAGRGVVEDDLSYSVGVRRHHLLGGRRSHPENTGERYILALPRLFSPRERSRVEIVRAPGWVEWSPSPWSRGCT